MSVQSRSGSARRITTAAIAAAAGLAIALGTAGCSAGQVSQTANQQPAVNGANVTHGHLDLRDVQIVYPMENTEATFADGGPFQIAFKIANDSPVNTYRLVSITAEQGSISVPDNTTIAPGRALRAGNPSGLLNPDTTVNDDEQRIAIEFTDAPASVTPGLNTDLTFTFERVGGTGDASETEGQVVVHTPVDAGVLLPRQDEAREAEPDRYQQVRDAEH